MDACYMPGDRFRSAIDKAWWLGTIKAQKPLNPNFPDSMFQCFLVKWDNGEKEHMSPWDFEPIDNERLPDEEGGSVEITPEERLAMMYVPEPDEWSEYGCDHDCDRIARGLARIMELNISESFVAPVDLNLYPSYAIVVEYPMDLGTIKARVQNRFYRRLDAIRFDVRYIEINALKFNEPGSRIVKQAKCVVDLCIRFINSSHCSDPMVLYSEMMEAKQSRSQDSQSELDVLCSEIDSDGENNASTRIKRKKQNALHHSSKRVRLGNQKYTSCSWRQQCASLLTTFFQCDDSTPFRHPVNLNDYPDYRNIIDIPMDLSTVQERLNSNHYSSPSDFCKDMRLIFQNSRNYNTNKKSRIYSMTIRLSAMFEEHIRSIISDWRSAVKYEEKIRNNQYVSNRRKPLPLQEPGINIGASTSRGSSQPSTSRSESSRNSRHTWVSNASEPSSSRSHMNRLTNGSGPRKKIKQEETQSSKGSSVGIRKKVLKPSSGATLTNGVKKSIISVQKRKLPHKSPKKHSERLKRKEYEEYSQSDSNPSDHADSISDNRSDDDTEWNHGPKRRRKDTTSNLVPKSLRPRIKKKSPEKFYHRSTRSSNHPKSSIYSSLRTHTRTTSSYAISSRSSSPDNRWVSKKTIKSPLHTRSKRLCNSSVAKSASSCYRDSDQTSDSDDVSESQSFKSEKNSNSSGGSSKSSSSITQSQSIEDNSKSQQSDSSSESEQSEENSRPGAPRKSTRVLARSAKVSALPARMMESPRKSGRILTRNRGARTVQYQEGNSDDSEDDESMQSYNSRGSLRSLMNDDEQIPGIHKRATEKSIRTEEDFIKKASSFDSEKHFTFDGPSTAYGAKDYNPNLLTNSNDGVSKLHKSLKTYTRPYKRYMNSIPLRTRSAMNKQVKTSKSFKRNFIRESSVTKDDDCSNEDELVHKKNKPTKLRITSSYGLRKCSKLIKRSVYRKGPYSSLMGYHNNATLPGTSFRGRRPKFITKSKNFVPSDESQNSNNLYIRMKNKLNRNVRNTRKNAGSISFNTRSKLDLTSTNSEESSSKKSIHKPTIVFCKPSVLTDESDSKHKSKTINAGSSSHLDSEDQINSSLSEKHVSSQNVDLNMDISKLSYASPISSHTRSSDGLLENNKDMKKQFSSNTSKRIQCSTKADNLKKYYLKVHKGKLNRREEINDEKVKENSNSLLGNNKSKWCLRKQSLTSRVSSRISQSVLHSRGTESNKMQTRNRGQRTVIYTDDLDSSCLKEIFENEDPIKVNNQQTSNRLGDPEESPDSSISNHAKSTLKKSECSTKCSSQTENNVSNSRRSTFPRPKGSKTVSNGIETRNHGQRTTLYDEDADDYLEEYFESFDLR
ncbi:PH-interacting protein [Trichonephila clavipes]|nr:PH-interacting protein [Trichonephila clavipes]